eukprot:TRINITY_DN5701_c2_g4_i1.p1 TRINITY_DN5701_c2_g4~~TRINITY_DN5701_c2_g4_i1.p1  ORF type:complete len:150 (+),score=19.77 TRINITY_DN5701_c2_g4_i1:50-451(+)
MDRFLLTLLLVQITCAVTAVTDDGPVDAEYDSSPTPQAPETPVASSSSSSPKPIGKQSSGSGGSLGNTTYIGAVILLIVICIMGYKILVRRKKSKNYANLRQGQMEEMAVRGRGSGNVYAENNDNIFDDLSDP